jgi:hypothetical protein
MSNEEKLENLQIVNAGLQATLTQRNQRITQLEEQLREARSISKGSREYKIAYKKGWQEAMIEITNDADTAARALGKLAKSAWSAYKQGERE